MTREDNLNLESVSSFAANEESLQLLSDKQCIYKRSDDDKPPASNQKWTREQWIILITHNSLLMLAKMEYSLLASFFPQEAARKGTNPLTIGFIFGIYELVVFLVSPVFGVLAPRLTVRWMSCSGSFVSSLCLFLFGCLYWCENTALFIALCITLRAVNALAVSMTCIANDAILALAFPDHLALVTGFAEMSLGLGYTIGPGLGGLLYDYGGFFTPFGVVGGLTLAGGLAVIFGPLKAQEGEKQESILSLVTYLRHPGFSLILVYYFGASVALIYLDPIISPWLETSFSLSMTSIGLILMAWAAAFTLVAPVSGKLIEKGYVYSLIFIGSLLQCLTYLLLGPSPLLQTFITRKLWLACLSVIMVGVTSAITFIPAYMAAINLLLAEGHLADTKLYAMIAGLETSSYSLGAFVGPVIASHINEVLGFEWSTTIAAFIILGYTVPLAIYCAIQKFKGKLFSPAD